MNGAVIIHRWFERGAGWAYAPELETIKLDAIASLDQYLKAANPGRFCTKLSNGAYLTGTVARDAECSDPRAKERRPTILRAVLLDYLPDDDQMEVFDQQLGRLWPNHPGPDKDLAIEASDGPSRQTREGERSTVTKKVVVSLLVTAAILLSIVISSVFLFRPIERSKVNLKPVADEMKRQLDRWDFHIRSTTPDTTINQYLKLLSQAAGGNASLDGDHPYLEFVKRLPRGPARSSTGRWTKQEIDDVLKKLGSNLAADKTAQRAAHDEVMDADDSLRKIAELMDYDNWRRKAPKRPDEDNRFAVAPDPHVIEFVERFRKRGGTDFVSAAETIKRGMAHWQDRPVDGATPFKILQTFFRTLVRPKWLDGLDNDRGHAYWHFADRLPGSANCLGWTCDDTVQLNKALRQLFDRLRGPSGGSPDSKTTNGLVEAIVSEMNYAEWVKREKGPMQRNGKPTSDQLIRFVEQFGSTDLAP